MSGKTRLFINPRLCTGCRICELACSMIKEEQANPLKSRIKVVNTYYFNTAVTCRLCEKAPCVRACPMNAVSQDKTTGIITIDESKCIGCDWCIQACPFGAIDWHPEKKVVVCDLCKGEPECSKYCPTKAIEMLPVDSMIYKEKKEAVLKMLPELL